MKIHLSVLVISIFSLSFGYHGTADSSYCQLTNKQKKEKAAVENSAKDLVIVEDTFVNEAVDDGYSQDFHSMFNASNNPECTRAAKSSALAVTGTTLFILILGPSLVSLR